MNISQAIQWKYPTATVGRDFLVQDDSNGNGAYIAQWNLTGPQPTPEDLNVWSSNATEQNRVAGLHVAYMQTITQGFNVTVSGTQYTFGWQTQDIATMDATQTAVDKGFLTFPIQYADIHGNPVTIPDQATLNSIEHTATNFFAAQHQQVLNLISNGATTWTPATY